MKKLWFAAVLISAISCSREASVDYVYDNSNQNGNGNGNTNPPTTTQNLVKTSFIEDHSVISNPERGFYIRREFRLPNELISNTEISRIKADKHSLVFIDFRLEDFINKPISTEMLTMMQNNFDRIRNNGVKAGIRFAYSSTSKEGAGVIFDAEPSIVLGHIAQLKPLLEKNKDVISVIEAGFIGAYGEWYYSTHYGNKSQADYAKRRVIINAMLDAFPKDRMIPVRTPMIKANLLNISLNNPLTESEAFSQSNKARLAHHNDCFLADATDMGTFRGQDDRLYAQNDSKYTVMGGETCTVPNTYSQCNNALETMRKYHWSYLNMSYHQGIINDWKSSNCFEEIQKKLGYRFVMKDVQYSEKMIAGQNYQIVLSFENQGFASPYNPRKAEIKFRSVADGKIYHSYQLKSNPQFWFSGTNKVDETFQLPANLPAGKYDVLLSLPDASASIATRPEYAIRFANTGTWESNTGYNKLYTQVRN